MATIGTLLNLADVRRSENPNDLYAKMIEMLAQENPILEDIPYVECNKTSSHQVAIRTGLPTSTWRAFNQGVATSKSSKAIAEFATGELAARSEIDKKLADLGGNPAEVRMSEAKAHIEGMSQDMATTIFYGNEALTPNKFTGLARYYSSISGAESSDNVYDHGGSGSDNASIFLVSWGEDSIHGLYPKGHTAGLQHEDKGVVELQDSDGNKFDGYADAFSWYNGLAVKDWRYAGRVCNVDVSVVRDITDKTSVKKLIDSMTILSERVKGQNKVWYMNPTLRTALRLGINDKIVNNLTWGEVAGKRVMLFDEMPVRAIDALVNSESRVV